jgi:hypothetical protein
MFLEITENMLRIAIAMEEKMKPLEQVLENVSVVHGLDRESIDLYAQGTVALYSGDGFQTNLCSFGIGKSIEGPGSILRNSYNLDDGYKLQERFDFSKHNNTVPHINYEIRNPLGSVDRNLNSLLDDSHQVNLDI